MNMLAAKQNAAERHSCMEVGTHGYREVCAPQRDAGPEVCFREGGGRGIRHAWLRIVDAGRRARVPARHGGATPGGPGAGVLVGAVVDGSQCELNGLNFDGRCSLVVHLPGGGRLRHTEETMTKRGRQNLGDGNQRLTAWTNPTIGAITYRFYCLRMRAVPNQASDMCNADSSSVLKHLDTGSSARMRGWHRVCVDPTRREASAGQASVRHGIGRHRWRRNAAAAQPCSVRQASLGVFV